MAIERKIRGITIEFGADATKLLKTFSEIQHRSNNLKKIGKDIDKLLKFNPRNVELMSQKQGQLNRLIGETKDRLKTLDKMGDSLKMEGLDETSSEFQAVRREILDTEKTLEDLQKQFDKIGRDINFETSPYKALSENLTNIGNKVKSVGERIAGLGDLAYDTGKKMTFALTLPIAGLGKKAFDSFSSYESALAGVSKTTELSGESLEKFGEEAQKMSRELPFVVDEILNVSEAAGQLGIEEKNLLSFSETMLRLGQSTNMTAEQAAIQIARFQNITGMAQEDTDRFGAAVVDLGNNFATTEGEIVNMAQKLAGTSKVVGLSDQQILGLSATLSSMGVSAELGGTNLSKVMQKMNSSVISGGKELEAFAKVSGTSAKEFANQWKKDPVKAMTMFLDSLNKSGKAGENTIAMLKDVGIKSQREIDIVQRLAGNTDLLTESVNTSNKAWGENTALIEESNKRNKTTESRVQMLKNRVRELAIQFGEALLPALEKLVPHIENVVTYFSEMSDEQKENIVKIGALVASLGPLLMIFGAITKPIGEVIKGFGNLLIKSGNLVKHIAGNGGILKSVGLLAGKFKFLLGPVGIAIGAFGALATAGVLLGRKLSERALPEVDVFGEGVSESSEKAVKGFLDMDKKVGESLKQMLWTSSTVTEKTKKVIVENVSGMAKQITDELKKERDDSIKLTKETLETLGGLTNEEKQVRLKALEEGYDKRIETTEKKEKVIKEIMEKASKEKRELTFNEQKTIERAREAMQEEGIKTLTASEKEFLIIRQRMKDNATELSAEESANIVKNSLKARDEAVALAEDEYDEKIRIAEEMKLNGDKTTRETADLIIANAKRQRDEAVRLAENQHKDVVTEAQAQAEEQVDKVDWSTGEMLTKWDIYKNGVAEKWEQLKEDASNFWTDIGVLFSESWEWIKENLSNAWTWITENLSIAWEEIKEIPNNALEWIKEKLNNAWTWITEKLNNAWELVKEITNNAWEWIRKYIVNPLSEAVNFVSNTISFVVGIFKDSWDWIVKKTNDTWEWIKKYIINPLAEAKKSVSNALKSIGQYFSDKWNYIKTLTSNVFGKVQRFIEDPIGSVQSFLSRRLDNISGYFTKKWNRIATITRDKFDKVKSFIKDPIGSAQRWLQRKVDRIKNAFDFTWKLPTFNLPKLRIGSKTGPFGIKLPTFNLDWHREGGIFNKPTLLAGLNGLHGVGEPSTGGEAIMPLNKLPNMMAEALDKSTYGKNQTIVNYIMLDGKVIGKEVTNTVDKNLGRKVFRERISGGL